MLQAKGHLLGLVVGRASYCGVCRAAEAGRPPTENLMTSKMWCVETHREGEVGIAPAARLWIRRVLVGSQEHVESPVRATQS